MHSVQIIFLPFVCVEVSAISLSESLAEMCGCRVFFSGDRMFVTLNVSPRNFIRTIKHQTWILEILPQAGDFDRVRQMVEERPELVSLASGEGWSLESWMFQVLRHQKLTWHPKIKVWKIIFLFKGVIFRFHVCFVGGIVFASVLLGVAVNYLRLGLLIVSAVSLFDYGFFFAAA